MAYKNRYDAVDAAISSLGLTKSKGGPPLATAAAVLLDNDGNIKLSADDLSTSYANLLASTNGLIAAGAADGLGSLRVARATFDAGVTANRTVAAHTLGVTIPDKAVVVGGFMQVNTVFTSAGNTATVAVSVQSANDIVTAAAVSGAPYSTTGLKAITPKANTPESTGIALTAARLVTATVAVQALTAGKATIFLYYVVGA